MDLSTVEVKQILTRTSGFLTTVSSHSLQPYRGCALGNSLCGVGCYVQHNWYLTRGEPWGSFVESRTNAAEAYARQYESFLSDGRLSLKKPQNGNSTGGMFFVSPVGAGKIFNAR